MNQPCMTYWYGNVSNITSRVKYLKEAGFKYVSLHWCDDYESSNGKKEDIYNYLKKNNIKINVFHMPFEEADNIWLNNEKGDEVFLKYLTVIKDAKVLDVSKIVIHLTQNLREISNLEIGIKRIRKLLQEASKRNLIIAFENLQNYDALELVKYFSRFKSFALCYDTGHFNIKNSEIIVNNLDKIKVVHLHNNYGIKDTHNLLFEGTVNWDILKKIINNPEVTFVLEIKNNHQVNEEEFLKQAKDEFSELMKTLK